MLETLLRDIDAADLNAFARTMTTPADFELTRTVMPERRLNSVKFRIKSSKRRVNAAKFRAYDAQTAVARRQAEKIITEGMLPPLGQKLIVGELEQILLDTARGADSSEFVELLYDDIERHVESIHNRMELAAGDLLVDGKFSLNGENGLTLEADFGVPDANMPTAAQPWSDPTSDPIADELRWIEYLRSIGAPLPARVLASYKARATLSANDAYRAAYYGSVNGSTTPTAVLAPNEVEVVRARYNLPPITIYDVQISVDDAYQRVIPEDRWILLPPNPESWAETQYGITAESLVLSSGTNPAITREDAPGIVITADYQDDPVQVWTKGAAVAMPVMYVPDIHVTAKVL
ncbi:major capsid protein [Streptomyces sp. NPDC048291]|uniref:major capsid protein n=1 Tax=Streptomyces sp. NPDC048291 TaxID=3365530 RepID=UPI00372492A2